MSTYQNLPSLVGGIPSGNDLPFSMTFAALYGLLLPVFIFRVVKKTSRNTILLGTVGYVVERTIMFSLRSVDTSEEAPENKSEGFLEYTQTTLAIGFIALIQDLAFLLRTVLVNSSYGTDAAKLSKSKHSPEIKLHKSNTESDFITLALDDLPPLNSTVPDHASQRFWFRRMHDFMNIVFIVILVTGSIGNCRLIIQRSDPRRVKENQALRLASASLCLSILVSIVAVSVWAYRCIPNVNKKALTYLIGLNALLMLPNIYRIVLMNGTSSSYEFSDPDAYGYLARKVVFYVLDVLPEWIATLVLCSINVRQIFETGISGDTKWRDETAEESKKEQTEEPGKRCLITTLMTAFCKNNNKQ